jgi:hypothetical protein
VVWLRLCFLRIISPSANTVYELNYTHARTEELQVGECGSAPVVLPFHLFSSSSQNNLCQLSTHTNRGDVSRRMWIGFGCASLPSSLLLQTPYVNSVHARTEELQVGERESGLRFPFIFSLCSSPITYVNSHSGAVSRRTWIGPRLCILPLSLSSYLSVLLQTTYVISNTHTHTEELQVGERELVLVVLPSICPSIPFIISLLLLQTRMGTQNTHTRGSCE